MEDIFRYLHDFKKNSIIVLFWFEPKLLLLDLSILSSKSSYAYLVSVKRRNGSCNVGIWVEEAEQVWTLLRLRPEKWRTSFEAQHGDDDVTASPLNRTRSRRSANTNQIFNLILLNLNEWKKKKLNK